MASGVNRVDEAALAALLGEGIAKADAAFVRERTGFAIGGVAPVGHREPPVIFIDQTLLVLRGDLGGGRHAQCRLPADARPAGRADRWPRRQPRLTAGASPFTGRG